MVRTVSTTRRSTVTLHDGREVRIVVRFGEPSPPEALPNSADVILHALGDDLHDAVAVAEALQTCFSSARRRSGSTRRQRPTWT